MARRLLTAYIFSLPFVSAFAITGTLTISLLLSLVMFIVTVREILITAPSFIFPVNYLLIVALIFLVTVLLSYSFNSYGLSKSTNHLLAYTTTVVLFFLTPLIYFFVFKNSLTKKSVLKAIFQVTLLCTVFTIIEFFLKNFIGVDINEYLPGRTLKEFDALAMALFQRARGFAEEPGHFALFLEIFTPVSVYYTLFSGYNKRKIWWKVLPVLIIYVAWLLTVSAAGFISLPIAILITLLINAKTISRKRKSVFKFVGIAFIITLLFLIVLNAFFPVIDLIWFSISEKSGSTSVDDRTDRISFFNQYFFTGTPLNYFFGFGPAGYSNLGFDETRSIVSFYLTVIFETGICGFLSLAVLLVFIVLLTYQLNFKERVFLQIAFLTGLLHYLFISNYWFPWIWFIGGLIFFLSSKKKQLRNEA